MFSFCELELLGFKVSVKDGVYQLLFGLGSVSNSVAQGVICAS